jgi:transcriptional regulator
MRANNFAIFVSTVGGELTATPLPLVIVERDETLVLCGHFAKANPQWRAIDSQSNLIIFSGAHAYISPTHYEKVESVPTWNYMTVHAYGRAKVIDYANGSTELHQMMSDLIHQHESSYHAQWDGLSDKFREGMLNGVVGFEVVVERLEGKFKLSQNKTAAEQTSIATALSESKYEAERLTGLAMQARLPENPI